jgi:predicted TIM-barrel fold metal-dependent hydrolase
MILYSKYRPYGLNLVIFFVIFLFSNRPLYSQELYFIDAHSQVSHDIGLEEVVTLMKAAGIRKTILSARKKRTPEDIAELAESYPDLIVAAMRTKGKDYKHNKPKYYKKLEKQASSDRYDAIAEVHLYHSKKGARATHVEADFTDRRVMAAFDVAKKNNWPFIIHIEFSALQGKKRDHYMDGLKGFLREHQDHPVALIHMGQLYPNEVGALINEHKNIYFLTSHSNPITISLSSMPWVNMFNNSVLAPAWKEVITAHPERFIFAIDNVYPEQWRNNYREQVELWRNALTELPSSAAHAIAHKNAESLWGLK